MNATIEVSDQFKSDVSKLRELSAYMMTIDRGRPRSDSSKEEKYKIFYGLDNMVLPKCKQQCFEIIGRLLVELGALKSKQDIDFLLSINESPE